MRMHSGDEELVVDETETSNETERDWLLPAMLVAIVAFVIFVVVVAAAYASSDGSDTSAGSAEAWTRCMRAEGVPVPLVEDLGNGEVRVTFDVDGPDARDDREGYAEAFAACRDQAPERVREFAEFLERPPWERWLDR
ncbi:MAG: hypothetical protein ACR2N9_06465 [Acidimicrobiia bacterium]